MMSKIQCDTHQLLYIIHLVDKFQIVIMYECKVICIQIPKSNQMCSFLTLLGSISRLTSLLFMMSKVQYDIHQLLYIIHLVKKFQIVIMYKCKVIYIQIPKGNQICSFLTLLGSISRLTSLCINNGQNSIRYSSTTIYYPSCQQISDCYNLRVQSYSHAISKSDQICSFLTLWTVFPD